MILVIAYLELRSKVFEVCVAAVASMENVNREDKYDLKDCMCRRQSASIGKRQTTVEKCGSHYGTFSFFKRS